MIKLYGHVSKADECQLDDPPSEYDQMRADYERIRLAEEIRIVSAWKAANGYDDLLRAYAASVDEVARLRELNAHGTRERERMAAEIERLTANGRGLVSLCERAIRYAREDRMRTPGSTRLQRVLDQIGRSIAKGEIEP